jgi:hypothetical protein
VAALAHALKICGATAWQMMKKRTAGVSYYDKLLGFA